MALLVVSDFINEARVLLQDQVLPYRYPDVDLLQALSDAMLEVRKLRPDLFLALNFIVPQFTAVDSTKVNMDQQYQVALVYYIVGRAQSRDEEWTQDSRAAAFLERFRAQLTGMA